MGETAHHLLHAFTYAPGAFHEFDQARLAELSPPDLCSTPLPALLYRQPSRSVALEPTGLSLSVTSTWTRSARSWVSSRRGQPRCVFLTARPGSFARTWRRSGFRPACPRRIITPSAGTFSRRVRSSNAPQTERRPPGSLICSGTCIFERTKRLIATRVHDWAAALCLGLTPAPAARKIQTRQQGGNAERAAHGGIGSGHLTAAHSGA